MKSIVLCGSVKYATEIAIFGAELRKLGVVVYLPIAFGEQPESDWDTLKPFDKTCSELGLTHGHFHKVRLADTVLIYNKNGTSGCSTTLELGYAVALNKPVYSIEVDSESALEVLSQAITPSPKDLLEFLK